MLPVTGRLGHTVTFIQITRVQHNLQWRLMIGKQWGQLKRCRTVSCQVLSALQFPCWHLSCPQTPAVTSVWCQPLCHLSAVWPGWMLCWLSGYGQRTCCSPGWSDIRITEDSDDPHFHSSRGRHFTDEPLQTEELISEALVLFLAEAKIWTLFSRFIFIFFFFQYMFQINTMWRSRRDV